MCDTAEKADWLLRRMGGAQRRQEAARALAAERIEQVQTWLDAELRRHQHKVDWAAGELEGYTRRALAADPLRKTIHLPAGELRARQQPDTWEVDAPSLVDWATAAGRDDLVIVKRSPDRSTMKRELVVRDGGAVDQTTGERVPGVTVLPGGVRYSAHPA